MLFAVVTGTPCLALDSGTGKVAQFHTDWLGDLDTVRLLPSYDAALVARHVTELRGLVCDPASLEDLAGRFARGFEELWGRPRRPVDG
jgi:hypothetical protein